MIQMKNLTTQSEMSYFTMQFWEKSNQNNTKYDLGVFTNKC